MSKPQSPHDGVEFDLTSIAHKLRETDPYKREGRTAKTLVRTDDMRVVLIVMKAGAQMPEHDASATTTVQALQGDIQLELPRGKVTLSAGHLLSMAAGLPHDVDAVTDAAFLLTLGWSKGD